MRTAIVIGVLIGMLGCGAGPSDAPQGIDASADVAAPVDGCVQAVGNCGCVFEETIHYGSDGPQIITKVVCP